jgi:Xaa-Pro aminopeptidase
MAVDSESIDRNITALRETHLDLVICALPINVLLLSGYWPVIGNAICVFTSDGETHLFVPEDEKRFTEKSWADRVVTFLAGSLDSVDNLISSIWTPLYEWLSSVVAGQPRIGLEGGPVHVPAPYVAMNIYGDALPELLRSMLPHAAFFIADQHLTRLRSTLTRNEIEKVRIACSIAAGAFDAGRTRLRSGVTERQAANAFRDGLNAPAKGFESVTRMDGQTFCMSGRNSYNASAAFQYSGGRRLAPHDVVLIHCNSCVDGYWTDITRTYSLGKPDERTQRSFDAVLAARQAALNEIGPGVRAADVDRAARAVTEACGFGNEFKHGLGHAVGFHAIDHNAPPRLHPKSPDTLETGMVFNIEPAIYIENSAGVRHCDMVAVTDGGAELLTPFQSSADELFLLSESVAG